MSQITVHALDTQTGLPAARLPVALSCLENDLWTPIAERQTDDDGRVSDFPTLSIADQVRSYRVHFDTKEYYRQRDEEAFYPWVDVVFNLDPQRSKYHIPLLFSPFSYTTYRGS